MKILQNKQFLQVYENKVTVENNSYIINEILNTKLAKVLEVEVAYQAHNNTCTEVSGEYKG